MAGAPTHLGRRPNAPCAIASGAGRRARPGGREIQLVALRRMGGLLGARRRLSVIRRSTLREPRSMRIPSPPSQFDRLRSAGVIAGPVAFITAWAVSGASTKGYSPIRDHISDLAAVGAPTRPLMNLGFAAFTVAVAAAAMPLRRVIGTPGSIALGVNAALSAGVALAPLGSSSEGDRRHQVAAAAGYLALAALAPAAAPALAKRSRGLAAASVGVGTVSMACLAASLVAKDQSGFWQRAGITATDAWLIAIGLLALTTADDSHR